VINRRELLARSAALGLAATLPGRVLAEARPAQQLGPLLQRISDSLLDAYPESATFLGVDSGAHRALRSRLTDRSVAGDARIAAACRQTLRELQAFDAAGLTGLDAVNLETTRYAYALAVEGFDSFAYGDNAQLNAFQSENTSPYVVNQNGGQFASVPDLLDAQHKIGDVDAAEDYLQRIGALAAGLDGENERLRRDAALGVIPPDFVLDATLQLQRRYLANPVPEWDLVRSLTRRTIENRLPGSWERRATDLCRLQVRPALARQIAILAQLRRRATHTAGVARLPDGDAYFRWALKVGTTTDLTPDEVHELGLDQVAQLTAAMDRLLVSQGISGGSVGARLQALNRDPRMLFANDDAGRAQLLAYLNGIVADMRLRLPRAFATQKKAALTIRRVPPSIEAGAAEGYEMDGPMDGSAPATYYINLRDMQMWPRFTLPTLCYHEGLPGHVWQGSFMHDLAPIRSQLVFNAYAEGWALYAEQLGDELGAYDTDPFGRLGYLQSIQLRACRLVADTGLNTKGWSREQAIRWMVQNNGAPQEIATGEVERYCTWPGQACGYLIGQRRIDALRAQAQAVLGARFDLRRFNDALLTPGTLPLTLLDAVMADFIAAQKKSADS
jgi:uncharacterized protein (DUF885 family)